MCKEVCKCQNWWNKLLVFVIFLFLSFVFCWFVGICIEMTIGIDSCEIIRIEIYLNNSWRYFWSKAIQEKPISCWNICEKKVFNEKKNSFTVFRYFQSVIRNPNKHLQRATHCRFTEPLTCAHYGFIDGIEISVSLNIVFVSLIRSPQLRRVIHTRWSFLLVQSYLFRHKLQ